MTTKVAILGCGVISDTYAPTIARYPHLDLVACGDADPARAAALSLWLHTAIWCWYLSTHADTTSWRTRPWYRHKHTASFADALAALRRNLWRQRITAMSANPALHAKITSTLLDVLAEAA